MTILGCHSCNSWLEFLALQPTCCCPVFVSVSQTQLSLPGTELLPGLVQTAWCWTPEARPDPVPSVKPRRSSRTRELRTWALWDQLLPRESSSVLLLPNGGQDPKLEGEELTLMGLWWTGVGGLLWEFPHFLPATSLCCPFPLLLSGTCWGPAKGTVRCGRGHFPVQGSLVSSLCTWDESLAYLPVTHPRLPASNMQQHFLLFPFTHLTSTS